MSEPTSKEKRPAARYVHPDLIPLTEVEKAQAQERQVEQSTVQRVPLKKRPSARARR